MVDAGAVDNVLRPEGSILLAVALFETKTLPMLAVGSTEVGLVPGLNPLNKGEPSGSP
jgi:hypothetical protein